MQQSETIQELSNTSKELSILQFEITTLRELSEAKKTENVIPFFLLLRFYFLLSSIVIYSVAQEINHHSFF